GRSERHAPAEARGGAATLLHGRPAERGGTGCPRPGHDQGEMHGLHPVVEWRFRKAVFNTIERTRQSGSDAAAEMEPIVFENVDPLYGLADIRGSSVQRGVAIQSDLLAQLRLAADVLRAAHEARALPALAELCYRVDKRIAQVQRSLNSGDEIG